MNRNGLYLIIGVLAIGIIVVGYLYYQKSQTGIDIKVGEHGLSIKGN